MPAGLLVEEQGNGMQRLEDGGCLKERQVHAAVTCELGLQRVFDQVYWLAQYNVCTCVVLGGCARCSPEGL